MNATDSTANDDDPSPDSVNAGGFDGKEEANEAWSALIGERFGIHLPDDLVSWFDDELWRSLGPGEYRHPATPKSLLSDVPDAVWPPLMPPNFLPLVGNGAGDWLCLRFIDPELAATTGQATDVCHWYHGGGDWLPWGNSLAEAMLFDWVLPELPQSDRRHADPAGPAETENDSPNAKHNKPLRQQTDHPWVQWAHSYLPGLADLDGPSLNAPENSVAHHLLNKGICETPVRCQLVIDALNNPLLSRINPKSANQMGLAWNDLMRWCFDLGSLPEAIALVLQEQLGLSESDLAPNQQSWAEVEEHAQAITDRAADLSWGHDLLGYCRLRRGDLEGAAAIFGQAIRCSVFTDQSIRLRTHWATASDGAAKFSARFLNNLSGESNQGAPFPDQLGCVPHNVHVSRMVELLGRPTSDSVDGIRATYSCWLLDQAKSVAADCPQTAARLVYAAGWDLGAEPLKTYGELLDHYIAACQNAGWGSHQRLASVHRQGLKARYNL